MSALRPATEGDLPQIMAIIAQAQAFLAANGVDQWQDGYPDEAVMRADIEGGDAYVLCDDNGRVQGIASILFDGEPTYDVIHEGAWTTGTPYACIHRIAVDSALRGSGAANRLMQASDDVVRAHGMRDIRIDTHRDNQAMQRMLARNGYQRCGIIYLADGSERIALEKRLDT